MKTKTYLWKTKKINQWITLVERPIELEDNTSYQLVTVRRGFAGVESRGIFKGKEIKVKNYFVVQAGDFLISKRQIAHGACGIVPESLDGAVVSNEYNVFVPQKETNIDFFFLIMQLPYYKRLFYLMSDGVHIEKLLFKTNDWMKRSLSLPPLPEQQKIATILSTQDKVIELKEKLLAQKQQQKKYLMQQLLTGKIKLANYPNNWHEIKLGEVSSMASGGTPDSKNKEYYGNTYNWISISDISNAGKYIDDSDRKLSQSGFDNCTARLFNPGTVLLAMYASVGKCAIARKTCCTSQAILGITPQKELVNEYLYYVLVNENVRLKSFSQASSQPNINKKIVEDVLIKLPSLSEQKAIVEILSTADREIDLIQKFIEAEKQKKKALMQLLLTGAVRVK